MERKLEGILRGGEFARCGWNAYRDIADMNGISLLYRQELFKLAPSGLSGLFVMVECLNNVGERLFEDTLLKLGCDLGSGIKFHLSEDGSRLAIHGENNEYITYDKVMVICCLLDLEKKMDLYLPYDAPRIIDALATKSGQKVYRYISSPSDESDKEIRIKSATQPWLRDGIMAGVKILAYLKENSLKINDLAARIPKFATATRIIDLSGVPTELLCSLKTDDEHGEGVFITKENGSVLVRPTKKGNKLKVLAESFSEEIAEELCVNFEEELNK